MGIENSGKPFEPSTDPQNDRIPHNTQEYLGSQDRFVISSGSHEQTKRLLNKKLILKGAPIDIDGQDRLNGPDLSESRLTELKKSRWSQIFNWKELKQIYAARTKFGIAPTDTVQSFQKQLDEQEFALQQSSVNFLNMSPREQDKTLKRFEEIPKEERPETYKNLSELGEQIDKLRSISNRVKEGMLVPDTYLEHLSHQIAYHNLQVGFYLPGGYTVSQVFKNNKGLIAYGLEPKQGSKKPPILLFQGTDPEQGQAHFIPQVKNNIAPDIGESAIMASLPDLESWLRTHRGATLTGHSLGGAKAQQLASIAPRYVGSVVTFCSPRVTKETADEFFKRSPKMMTRRKEDDSIVYRPITSVRHYLANRDPVDLAGKRHIYGNTFPLPSKDFANAHSDSLLLELQERKEDIPKPIPTTEEENTWTEWVRQSFIVQWYLKRTIKSLAKKASKT